MKKAIRILTPTTLLSMLAVALGLCLVSCDKDMDMNNKNTTAGLSAKVDGQIISFEENEATATISHVSNASYLTITCINTGGDCLFVRNSANSPNSPIEPGPSLSPWLTYSDGGTEWSHRWGDTNGSSGQLTILDYSGGRVKGTFSFTGVNDGDGSTKMVTEGSFDLPIE